MVKMKKQKKRSYVTLDRALQVKKLPATSANTIRILDFHINL